jgi:hypothetical protein
LCIRTLPVYMCRMRAYGRLHIGVAVPHLFVELWFRE